MSPHGRSELMRLAQDRFLAGQPLEMRRLAADLGVGRATVYRWAGSREQLLGEVLWASAQQAVEAACRHASGEGVRYLLDMYERVLTSIASDVPLRRLLTHDPELALRVLTSQHSVVQPRMVAALRAIFQGEVDRGAFRPPVDLDTLSYAAVRIGESFLYSDIITGTERDVRGAVQVVALLLREC